MGKRILIVEDNSDVRQMERDLLESNGYQVIEADNAKDGIRLALEEIPDLIIMDIRLPNKKRGIGAARIIRANEKTKDIPIVFVTAYAEGEHTKEISNIPNCGFIAKPFHLETFIEEIVKRIER